MEQISRTPEIFSARPVTTDDADEIMRIVNAAVFADVELCLYRDGDLQKEWEGRDPDDLIAIESSGDGVVAFASFEAEERARALAERRGSVSCSGG